MQRGGECIMPTVINNPSTPSTETGSGFGAVVSVIVILIVAILFFMYALPNIRGRSGTQINVPDKIQIDNGGGQNGGQNP